MNPETQAEIRAAFKADLEKIEAGEPVYYPYRDPPLCTMEMVLDAVCVASGFTRLELRSDRRARGLSWPRMLAMFLMCECCKSQSLPAIGAFMNRDHTTVLYARRTIPKVLARKGPDSDRLREMNQEVRDILGLAA